MVKLGKNKRGVEQNLFFIIFELLAIGVIAFTMLAYVESLASNSYYWRTYYAKDLSTIMTLSEAAHGDIALNYDLKRDSKGAPIFALAFNIFDGKIEINDTGDKAYSTNYFFAKDSKINIIKANLFPNFLSIQKSSNNLGVYDTPLVFQEACPDIDTALTDKTLPLEIFYIETIDSKFKSVPIPGSLRNLVEKNMYIQTGAQIVRPRLALDWNDNPSSIILFQNIKDPAEKDKLKIYFYPSNLMKNKKLACMLREDLAQYYTESSIESIDAIDSATKASNSLFSESFDKKTAVVIFMDLENQDSAENKEKYETMFATLQKYYGIVK